MRRFLPLLLTAVLCGSAGSTLAGVVIDPGEAPEWRVSEWIGGDPGRLSDHKGRIVIIEFFQLWCPGCNSFSIPLMQHWDQLYGDRDDVLLLSIHTVFEGHEFQPPERLKAFVAEKRIGHVVGIDEKEKDSDAFPITMNRFDTGGTPHIAIVDKEGILRFSAFGSFDPEPVESFIDRLLKERTKHKPRPKPVVTLPDAALSGSYLVWVEQTAKSCGPLQPRKRMPVRLVVHQGRIEIESDRPLFGTNRLTADYDANEGTFSADVTQRHTEEGDPVTVRLAIEGSFTEGVMPPRLVYEFTFSSLSSRHPEKNCDIQGKGDADRIGF